MTIRHLKIFIAVAETGKMNLAANRLFLSQPTVSQAIHELEKHYDTLLFERLSKRLYITPQGRYLLELARKTVYDFDALETQMQSETRIEHFRLGATVTVGSCLLPPLLTRFRDQHPNVDIFSFISNTRVIEEKLLHSELDAGVVEGVIHSPDLVSLPVVKDSLVLACSVNHPLAQKSFFSPSDLEGMDFVMRERGSGTRALFEEYLEQHHIRICERMEAPFPEAVRNAVLYNNCLAVISLRLMEDEIKKGTIRIFHHPENAWDRTFNLVYHKDKFISESILTVKELLYEFHQPEVK